MAALPRHQPKQLNNSRVKGFQSRVLEVWLWVGPTHYSAVINIMWLQHIIFLWPELGRNIWRRKTEWVKWTHPNAILPRKKHLIIFKASSIIAGVFVCDSSLASYQHLWWTKLFARMDQFSVVTWQSYDPAESTSSRRNIFGRGKVGRAYIGKTK